MNCCTSPGAMMSGVQSPVTVVVPCYNERPNVAPLIARLDATPAPSGQEEEWRRTSLDGLPRDAGASAVPAAGTFD